MTTKALHSIRNQFPILTERVKGKTVAYLDSAATTQKPQSVIDAESKYYETANANVHRGMYHFAEQSTELYEGVRSMIKEFIRARRIEEIIFTRNTTHAINMVAFGWAAKRLRKGDRIILTEMEHHSNIVPWQQVAEETGAVLEYIPVTEEGMLDIQAFEEMLTPKTKVVAVTAASNVLGTITPIKDIVKKAHGVGAMVLVDAAQYAAHAPIDVEKWDCDFLALSAHKMYGPMGVGVLYGKQELLETMHPFEFGGEMILEVHKTESSWNTLPHKFEAGTPNVGGVVGFGAAIQMMKDLGWEVIMQHEAELTEALIETVSKIPGTRIFGPQHAADEDETESVLIRTGVVSFSVEGIHPHDLATIFDEEGVAIRSGHHCAQVLMQRFDVPALARASIGIYTNLDDIKRIPKAMERARKILVKNE